MLPDVFAIFRFPMLTSSARGTKYGWLMRLGTRWSAFVALFPGSFQGREEPGTHCLRIRLIRIYKPRVLMWVYHG